MRFPEFKGEWKLNILDSVCTFHNGRAYKQHELLSAGKYRVLRVGNFFTNDSWYYSDLELEEDKTASDGELLYAWSASFGPRFWKGEKVIYHYHIWKIDSFQEVCKEFLFYFLEKDAASIKNEVQGGTMAHITKADMERRNITYPTICEQSKIARLLFLLDHRIATQNKIIEDLKKLKSSLLDLLFQNDSKWSTYCISDVLTIGNGRDYKHLKEGNIPVYGTGGYMLSVNDYLYEGESVCIGRKGTIDMPMFLTGKFWTVDTLFYTYNFRNILPRFCYYLFTTINWSRYNEASGVPSLSKTTIEKIKVSVPSLNEQERICSILDSVNIKINIEISILAKFKAQKSYLLRQMFI